MEQPDRAELTRIRNRFRATRENTLEAFRRIASQLGADPGAAEVIEALRRELHRIRGTAGSFGFADASKLAGAFEERAIRWSADPSLEREQREANLLRFISALDALLSETPEDDPAEDDAPPPLVLFVGEEALYAALSAEAALRKMRLRSLSVAAVSPEEVRATGAYVLMATLPVDRAVAEAARLANLPLVALETRARSARTVAEESSSATVTVDAVDGVGPAFDVAARLLARTSAAGATILAVDDDPVVLALMKALFPPPEFDLLTLQDGSRLFEVLATTEPVLLVLDVEMPNANGIDLVRALRAQPATRDLTVVLLSGATDAATRDAAFAAGADEFVAKPIVFAELRSRVADRLERRRAALLAAGVHPVTGLALPERAARDGADAIAELRQQQQAGSVAVVRPEGMRADAGTSAAWIREGRRMGRALLDLRRAVGYGESNDLVAVLACSADEAVARFSAMAGGRLEGAPRWRAGIADLADLDVVSYATARRAATEAVDAAIRDDSGPARRWTRRDSTLAPDVILVEDDPSLSDMMQYALRATGFTFEAFSDGLAALQALTAYDTQNRRPIVLLDVDLPGIDGYTLHERLRVLRPGEYSVIFVTVHASETDQLRALRSGAMDYISKPVNLRILMAKMTSWMQAARRPA